VPTPNPPLKPSPKRLIFSQPTAELQPKSPEGGAPAKPQALVPPPEPAPQLQPVQQPQPQP
jgi:hypothetical protein